MVHKHFARIAAVTSSLAAAVALSAVVAPPASATWPSPEPGLTYHWSSPKTWGPDGTTIKCQYRNGWAVVDSNTIRIKYQATCNTRVVSLGSEAYVSRGSTDLLNGVAGGDNTNWCYQATFCTTTYNFHNPAGAQDWASSVYWAIGTWTNRSPVLTQRFSK